MNIYGFNPNLSDTDKTYLSFSTVANPVSTLLRVKNSQGFNDGRKVLIGTPGSERSEMVTQVSSTPTTITVGATKFPHDADDPVYVLEYDQLRWWRSTTGINGVYDIIDTIDIDWTTDTGKTLYNDPDALDTYYYKAAFYDSIEDVSSDLSAPIKSPGFDRNMAGSIVMDMAARIKDKQFNTFSISEYISMMNDVNDDLRTRAKRPYRFTKKHVPIDVELGASSFPYPTDLWKIDYVEVNTTSIAYPRGPKELSPMDFRYRRNFNALPADYVSQIAYDDEADQVLFWPAARTIRLGAFTLHYYASLKDFTSLSDVIQTPTPLIYKLYLWWQFYLQKADDDTKYLPKAKDYENRYETEIMKLNREKNIKADAPVSLHPQVKRYRQ